MKESEKDISFQNLKSFYFGPQSSTEKKENAPVDYCANANLTPSARYVTIEAKKRIGKTISADLVSNLEESQLFELVKLVEREQGEELSESERNNVVAALNSSLEHYDILSSLIERPGVNDIIARAYNDISIQVGRQNIQTDVAFPSHEAYKSFLENLLKRVGKACTLANPVVDAAIDPNIRVCVTHESFSPAGSGPMLTLRVVRHPRITLEGLVAAELAPKPVLDYLGALVQSAKATILISGEVGTGKTTLVKALVSKVQQDEAVLIIEDTHEIVVERKFTRTLLTREANIEGAGRIRPAQAIRTGMRMAMNRIILGEMRDAESAEAFVDVCTSGHVGMSTIHGRNARDALSRLELFLLRAQPGVGVGTVRREITNAISVVVHLGLDGVERKRRVLEVLEIGSSADGTIQVSPIYNFTQVGGAIRWIREGGITKFNKELDEAGVKLAEPGCDLMV